jgi:hypothetical protein
MKLISKFHHNKTINNNSKIYKIKKILLLLLLKKSNFLIKIKIKINLQNRHQNYLLKINCNKKKFSENKS